MHRHPLVYLCGLAAQVAAIFLCVLLTGGCTDARNIVDPFNVLGIARQPVRIGITRWEFSTIMLPKQSLFRQDLTFYLDEPVVLNLMQPRQIRVHLGTGRLQFALLSPADFAEIAPAGTCEVLAVPINSHGDTHKRGLIVVAASSDVENPDQLMGGRFHRLPTGSILNEAAYGALAGAGLQTTDVDEGVLGLGFGTVHMNSLEVAKSVVIEGRNAFGVIDEAEYKRWPETGGSFLLLKPSKDQVRVIATTVTVPAGPIVVSKKTSPELRKKVRDYLFSRPPTSMVLASLDCRGFAPPIDPAEYEPFFRIHRMLNPSEPISETAPAEEPPLPDE